MTEPTAPADPPALQDAMERARARSATLDGLRREAAADAEAFWRKTGRRLAWMRSYTKVMDVRWSPDAAASHARWFEDGVLNVAFNCIDRHLPRLADTPAIIFEGEDPGDRRVTTYADLYSHVCRVANVLHRRGVKKGSRVVIHLPEIPELAYAVLACARIGAVYCVVSPETGAGALARAILAMGAVCVVTADEWKRGGEIAPLKHTVDEALASEEGVQTVSSVVVVRRTGADVEMAPERDSFLDDLALRVADECDPEEMNAEDPLFIVPSTDAGGETEWISHASGGWLAWAAFTHEQVFDHGAGDVFWLAGSQNPVSSLAYAIHGVLACGGTTLLCEGPAGAARAADIIRRNGVSVLHADARVLGVLAGAPGDPLAGVRLVAVDGGGLDAAAAVRLSRGPGDSRRPVITVIGRADAGGALLAGRMDEGIAEPAGGAWPLPGIRAELADAAGQVLGGEASGRLCIAAPWPGQARALAGDPGRLAGTRYAQVRGMFATDTACRRDPVGRYRLLAGWTG